MTSSIVKVIALALTIAVLASPGAWAEDQRPSGGNAASDIGLGVASFLVSVPYGAAKVATAIVGGVVGGFTYVLSGFNKRAADQVWYTTIPGDYVITPDHLRGKRDLRFTGVPPENPR